MKQYKLWRLWKSFCNVILILKLLHPLVATQVDYVTVWWFVRIGYRYIVSASVWARITEHQLSVYTSKYSTELRSLCNNLNGVVGYILFSDDCTLHPSPILTSSPSFYLCLSLSSLTILPVLHHPVVAAWKFTSFGEFFRFFLHVFLISCSHERSYLHHSVSLRIKTYLVGAMLMTTQSDIWNHLSQFSCVIINRYFLNYTTFIKNEGKWKTFMHNLAKLHNWSDKETEV